jgi:hypothetical protein
VKRAGPPSARGDGVVSRHGLLNHSDNQHWIGRLKAPPDRRTCANKNLCALILSADHTSADQGKARRIVVGA